MGGRLTSPSARPARRACWPRRACPVTRWNRKYLLAGAAVLASIVAGGFYLGFGGAHASKGRPDDLAERRRHIEPADAGDRHPLRGWLRRSGGAAGHDQLAAAGRASPRCRDRAGRWPARATGAGGSRRSGGARAGVGRPRGQPVLRRRPGSAAGCLADPRSGADAGGGPGAWLRHAARAGGRRRAAGQNGQGEKRQFAAGSRADDYLANPLRDAISPWEVKAGTIIPAALITAINSDLPGEVIAQVTEPVYDHATGRTVLIPQGSRLIGQYDSQVAYGQSRALIAWNRVIMPNGRSINIGSMTGADLTGASGLQDQTDGHFWQLARGVALDAVQRRRGLRPGRRRAQLRRPGDQQRRQRDLQRRPAGRPAGSPSAT